MSEREALVLPEQIDGPLTAPVVLTAEHASADLPDGWAWSAEDAWLVSTHWAVDLGIAEVTRRLAAAVAAPAVLATFSRLLVDPNRELSRPDLFRQVADGKLIHLNAQLTEEERHRRIERLYVPYHNAVDEVVNATPGAFVLSMHSFTPLYEGTRRPMELAVLFDEEEALGLILAEALAEGGWKVAVNEPYSGKEGLIYSAHRHAEEAGRPALEIEVRQDLATDSSQLPALVDTIAHAITVVSQRRLDGSS